MENCSEWNREESKHTPVMRYPRDRKPTKGEGETTQEPAGPDLGENRGKSGFHGNQNPHLEDELAVCRIAGAHKHRSLGHLPVLTEWCVLRHLALFHSTKINRGGRPVNVNGSLNGSPGRMAGLEMRERIAL